MYCFRQFCVSLEVETKIWVFGGWVMRQQYSWEIFCPFFSCKQQYAGEANVLFYVLLLCYFVPSFICFLVYSKSNYSEVVSNIQIYCTVFSLCTYLKADDTYIQLKKDLEYLDLKVRPYTSLLNFKIFFPTQLSFLYHLCTCKF